MGSWYKLSHKDLDQHGRALKVLYGTIPHMIGAILQENIYENVSTKEKTREFGLIRTYTTPMGPSKI